MCDFLPPSTLTLTYWLAIHTQLPARTHTHTNSGCIRLLLSWVTLHDRNMKLARPIDVLPCASTAAWICDSIILYRSRRSPPPAMTYLLFTGRFNWWINVQTTKVVQTVDVVSTERCLTRLSTTGSIRTKARHTGRSRSATAMMVSTAAKHHNVEQSPKFFWCESMIVFEKAKK
jgi:hypothetical protein